MTRGVAGGIRIFVRAQHLEAVLRDAGERAGLQRLDRVLVLSCGAFAPDPRSVARAPSPSILLRTPPAACCGVRPCNTALTGASFSRAPSTPRNTARAARSPRLRRPGRRASGELPRRAEPRRAEQLRSQRRRLSPEPDTPSRSASSSGTPSRRRPRPWPLRPELRIVLHRPAQPLLELLLAQHQAVVFQSDEFSRRRFVGASKTRSSALSAARRLSSLFALYARRTSIRAISSVSSIGN